MAAKSPGEAAAIFVKEYLKPRADLAAGRAAKYRRGVPGVECLHGGDNTTSHKRRRNRQRRRRCCHRRRPLANSRSSAVSRRTRIQKRHRANGVAAFPLPNEVTCTTCSTRAPMAGRSGMMKPNVLTEKGVARRNHSPQPGRRRRTRVTQGRGHRQDHASMSTRRRAPTSRPRAAACSRRSRPTGRPRWSLLSMADSGPYP